MAAAEQAPIAAPAFAVVRRGYDPDQVAYHLNRVDAETTILAADRAAAAEQASQLGQKLATCRKELDAARTEIDRLRSELRVLSGPPDTVQSMNERLQVMLRLAKDEFTGLRADTSAQAAAHAAEIIASVGAEPGDVGGFGFAEAELRGPRDEDELERMRRESAEERTRLDDEAATRRAAADEEFRQVLALRCREALAQLAKLQTEALRSARHVMDDADEQARTVLADAKDAVRQTVEDAQRQVDDLQDLRLHLAAQLDTSRQLLDRAIPEGRAAGGHGDAGSVKGAGPKQADQPPATMPPADPTPSSDGSAATAGPSPSDGGSTAPADPAPSGTAAPLSPVTAAAASTEAGGQHRAAPAGSPQAEFAAAQLEPSSAAGQLHLEHGTGLQLPPPTLPARAPLAVPAGWPVPPTSFPTRPAGAAEALHPAADQGTLLEQTQPGLADLGLAPSDTQRAQPMRIPPSDPEASDVPGPSRIPIEEQDQQVAPPRRYP